MPSDVRFQPQRGGKFIACAVKNLVLAPLGAICAAPDAAPLGLEIWVALNQ
jgi:hypothetical protein